MEYPKIPHANTCLKTALRTHLNGDSSSEGCCTGSSGNGAHMSALSKTTKPKFAEHQHGQNQSRGTRETLRRVPSAASNYALSDTTTITVMEVPSVGTEHPSTQEVEDALTQKPTVAILRLSTSLQFANCHQQPQFLACTNPKPS